MLAKVVPNIAIVPITESYIVPINYAANQFIVLSFSSGILTLSKDEWSMKFETVVKQTS